MDTREQQKQTRRSRALRAILDVAEHIKRSLDGEWVMASTETACRGGIWSSTINLSGEWDGFFLTASAKNSNSNSSCYVYKMAVTIGKKTLDFHRPGSRLIMRNVIPVIKLYLSPTGIVLDTITNDTNKLMPAHFIRPPKMSSGIRCEVVCRTTSLSGSLELRDEKVFLHIAHRAFGPTEEIPLGDPDLCKKIATFYNNIAEARYRRHIKTYQQEAVIVEAQLVRFKRSRDKALKTLEELENGNV